MSPDVDTSSRGASPPTSTVTAHLLRGHRPARGFETCIATRVNRQSGLRQYSVDVDAGSRAQKRREHVSSCAMRTPERHGEAGSRNLISHVDHEPIQDGVNGRKVSSQRTDSASNSHRNLPANWRKKQVANPHIASRSTNLDTTSPTAYHRDYKPFRGRQNDVQRCQRVSPFAVSAVSTRGRVLKGERGHATARGR